MATPNPDAREARIRAARRSPELANLHDEAGWLALYTEGAIVEDPVGSPPCQRGVFTRPGKQDDLERFFATFIAPSRIRVEECGDFVVGDTVVRDVVLHVVLPGGGGASVPAVLQYELVDVRGDLKVRRMRAYWDAGKNGRQMLAQGFRGKLTSILSGIRLFRVLGKDWAQRYIAGTKRGIRKEGAPKVEALQQALAAGATALDAVATPSATIELPGRAAAPLRTVDTAALGLTFERATSSGFVVVARCRATQDGRSVSGIAFVDFDESSRQVSGLRLFWE